MGFKKFFHFILFYFYLTRPKGREGVGWAVILESQQNADQAAMGPRVVQFPDPEASEL